jgi:hypothetical protein
MANTGVGRERFRLDSRPRLSTSAARPCRMPSKICSSEKRRCENPHVPTTNDDLPRHHIRLFMRMIARPHQRTRLNMLESEFQSFFFQRHEFFRLVIPRHG